MSSTVFFMLASLAAQLVSCKPHDYLPSPRLEMRDSSNSTNETDIYRRRALHSVMVMGDYLYIEGGEVSSYINGKQNAEYPSVTLNKTLSIDLTKSWTNETVTINEIDKAEPLPGNSIVLWTNDKNTTMYRWGGDYYMGFTDLADDVHLWAFDADGSGGGSWSSKRDSFGNLYSASSGAGASCGNAGYIVGGYGSSSSDSRLNDTVFDKRLPLPGILKYDMSQNTWENKSTVPLSPPYGTFNSGRGLCVEKFSNDSLLFVLGGDSSSRTSASRTDATLLDFSNVTFYDTSNDTWYWQTASGNIPGGREEFCAVGVAGEQTYDIYIYGGLDRTTGTLEDMYVLSLPGFQWFKLNTTGPARMRHACELVGNSQMIVVGGIDSEWDWEKQDPWAQAIGIYDLNSLEWNDKYDASAAVYTSPPAIANWYSGGGLDSVEWNNDDVKSWFALTSDFTTTSSGGSSSGSGTSSSSSSSPPAGTIAGATIGAVAGVGLLGAAFWLWRRKRRAGSESLATSPELDSKPAVPVVPVEPAHELAQPPSELAGSHKAKSEQPVELP